MRERGFTLVEMMIATAVSGVLLLALVVLYLGSDKMIRGINDNVRESLGDRVERERTAFGPARNGGTWNLPTGVVSRAEGEVR